MDEREPFDEIELESAEAPIVIRVLLGAAMLAIALAFFGALAWGLWEAHAGVR
jgi:hypothetical protein